jgi:hypothetical protein
MRVISLTNVKTIPIKGGIHDLNVTPDGKYVIAGSVRAAKPPANAMFVIDTRTNEIAWTLSMNRGPSPMAVSKKPDGSTDKFRHRHLPRSTTILSAAHAGRQFVHQETFSTATLLPIRRL